MELSDAAFSYLEKNIARYPQYAVRAVKADVWRDAASFTEEYTAILSNPPYIPTADLPQLMREVQHEPTMALDGDTDGLRFYRVIANEWVPRLRAGGVCAVEWSENVADALEDPIAVTIEKLGEDSRKITVTGGKTDDFSL